MAGALEADTVPQSSFLTLIFPPFSNLLVSPAPSCDTLPSTATGPGLCLPASKLPCAIFDGRNKNYLLDSLDHGVYCVPTNCGLPPNLVTRPAFLRI
jgi:hypothetical protein